MSERRDVSLEVAYQHSDVYTKREKMTGRKRRLADLCDGVSNL